MTRLGVHSRAKAVGLNPFRTRPSRRASKADRGSPNGPAPRLEVGQRPAHAVLERGLWDGLAECGGTPRLVSPEAELAERRDHFFGGGTCPRLRRPGRGLLMPSFGL